MCRLSFRATSILNLISFFWCRRLSPNVISMHLRVWRRELKSMDSSEPSTSRCFYRPKSKLPRRVRRRFRKVCGPEALNTANAQRLRRPAWTEQLPITYKCRPRPRSAQSKLSRIDRPSSSLWHFCHMDPGWMEPNSVISLFRGGFCYQWQFHPTLTIFGCAILSCCPGFNQPHNKSWQLPLDGDSLVHLIK